MKLIKMLTPKQFEAEMKTISNSEDTEEAHIHMDCLMADLLRSLGYGAGLRCLKTPQSGMPNQRTMRLKMTESQLQKSVIELAELLGYLVYHVGNVKGQLRNTTSVGFPDLCMVHRRTGAVVFAELKSDKGVLTERQLEWAAALSKCGGVSDVRLLGIWDPVTYELWRPEHWHDGTIERSLTEKAGRATRLPI